MIEKFEKIIPIGKQEFAYQGEDVSTVCVLSAHIPYKGGNHPYPNDEKEIYSKYKLVIEKFTVNSITVTIEKYRSDTVKQRTEKGKAIIADRYQTTMTFSQLVNQIFKGVEVANYPIEEHFPKEVESLMKTVYKSCLPDQIIN